MTSALDSNTNATIFDARDFATRIYAEIGSAKFSDWAHTWAAQVINVYSAHPIEFAAKAADDGTMAKGFLIGENQLGDIEAAGQVITHPLFSFINEQINIPFGRAGGSIPLFHNGHLEIMKEFLDGGRTERARKIIAEIGDKKDRMQMLHAILRMSQRCGIGAETTVLVEKSPR